MLTTINTAMVGNKEMNKIGHFYVLFTLLLITIAVLITVSIYSYVMKHQPKQNIYYHIKTPETN